MPSGAPPPPQGLPSGSSRSQPLSDAQQQFVQKVYPLAQNEQQRSGIPAPLLIGIAANETGWGTSSLARDQNNYFSIKGGGPAGSVSMDAWEVQNGQNTTHTSTFRAYSDPQQSFEDFYNFLKSNSRYQPALNYLAQNPNDWRGFVRMVGDAGYATDPAWADKVISIGDQFDNGGNNVAPSGGASTGIKSVIDVGATAIGSRYQWGGAGGRTDQGPTLSPTDCSGFVSWAYEQATGIRLPAQTQAIYASTEALAPKDAQPGDLVMYNMDVNDPTQQHVGIYMGDGMMLHDSSINPNGGVDVTPLWSGAEFRRVPGVDPTLVTQPQKQATGNVGSWAVWAHGGRQVLTGTDDSGRTVSEDMGPTSASEGGQRSV